MLLLGDYPAALNRFSRSGSQNREIVFRPMK
jgi:hypothetical protein